MKTKGSNALVLFCFLFVFLSVTGCQKAASPSEPGDTGTPPTYSSALDFDSFEWLSGGCAPWEIVTDQTHDSVDALKSGAIGEGCASTLTAQVYGPGKIEFWLKVSSDSGDQFKFYVDGSAWETKGGDYDWHKVTKYVPSFNGNPFELMWEYAKNSDTITGGSDAAWIDQVTYQYTTPVTIDNFTDCDLTSDLSTAWSVTYNAGSSSGSFGMTLRDGTNCAIGVTGTVKASGSSAPYMGTLGFEVPLSSAGGIDIRHQNLAVNIKINKTVTPGDTLYFCLKVVNWAGQYATTCITAPTTDWPGYGFSLYNMNPAGAYTTEDVLATAKTLDIYLQLTSDTFENTAGVEFFIDSVFTY
jgi:hypothetical protein